MLARSILNSFSKPVATYASLIGTTSQCFPKSYASRRYSTPKFQADNIAEKPSHAWDFITQPYPEDDLPKSNPTGNVRRQAMTAREINVFDDMFEMIFDAVNEPKKHSGNRSDVSVGKGDVGDLLGKLRYHSKRVRWSTESDEVLDRRKEAVNLCESDQQLLEWATTNVFQESQEYEEAARKAIAAASEAKGTKQLPMLQHPTYPHMIALLMRTFRDKYEDPYLALAIFNHARHLSIASYVFGCTTKAYNELIETRWSCFRDITGVFETLMDMKVNGVETDPQTQKLVENIRREISEHDLWVDGNDPRSDQIRSALTRIEELVATPKSIHPKQGKKAKWNKWKADALKDEGDDEWSFDKWDFPRKDRREVRTRFGNAQTSRRIHI